MAATHRKGGERVSLPCIVCATPFEYERLPGPGRLRRFCSSACKDKRDDRELLPADCATCGKSFLPRRTCRTAKAMGRGLYCSVACRPQAGGRKIYATPAEAKRAAGHRYRARKRGVGFERFTCREIHERDGWRCGLCSGPVNKRLKAPHPMRASVDHIVPLSKGGDHTRRNVQSSHWLCNSRKSNGAGGQLRLFG